jgi:hypothetical protein
VKFFTNNTASGNAPANSISYSVVNIPDAAGSGLLNLSNNLPATIKFRCCYKPVSQDVTIGAELDNSLVRNIIPGMVRIIGIPGRNFKDDRPVAHLVSGSTTSADSITIQTDLATVNSMNEKTIWPR